MAECSFTAYAPVEWYLIAALLACFALGTIQIRRAYRALFDRPRQTVVRALVFGMLGTVLCLLPAFDMLLFATGRPSPIVTIASARTKWCGAVANAEASQAEIATLKKRVAELEGERIAAQIRPAAETSTQPVETPPPAQPAAATDSSDDADAAPAIATDAKQEKVKVRIFYRKSHGDLARTLSARIGEVFESAAQPSDLSVKTRMPPGTVRIVYTESTAYALPDIRKAVDDLLRGDPEREIVADKVSDLRSGNLQVQLF